MLFKPTLTGVALAAALLVTAGPAKSANVNFHDLLDTVTVDATQFDVTPATITHMNIFGGEDDVRVTGQFFTNSPDGAGGNTTGLFEPNLPGGIASDVIRSTWSVSGGIATITLDFGSDPASCNEGGLVCGSIPTGKFEDGTLQNVNDILSLPANITVQIQSDIPEPTTLALLGVALAGVGFIRRKRG